MNTTKKHIKNFYDGEWCSCPLCGFQDCHIFIRGKNKGKHRCFECRIIFEKPVINKIGE